MKYESEEDYLEVCLATLPDTNFYKSCIFYENQSVLTNAEWPIGQS